MESSVFLPQWCADLDFALDPRTGAGVPIGAEHDPARSRPWLDDWVAETPAPYRSLARGFARELLAPDAKPKSPRQRIADSLHTNTSITSRYRRFYNDLCPHPTVRQDH